MKVYVGTPGAPTTKPTDPQPVTHAAYYAGTVPGTASDQYQFNSWMDDLSQVLVAGGQDAYNGNLLSALRGLFPVRLTAAVNYYVSTTGSDSTGNGSSGSPWATPQFAYNYIVENVYTCGFLVTINLAAGTYPNGILAFSPTTGGGLILVNGAGVGETIISTTDIPCFAALNSASLVVQNLSMQTTGSTGGVGQIPAGYCVYTQALGNVQWQDVIFGSAPLAHAYINGYGSMSGPAATSNGNYGINGNANSHIIVNGQASLECATVTLTGSAFEFSSGFIVVEPGSVFSSLTAFNISGAEFTGTSPRYNVMLGGTLWVNGAGPNYFPGNAAGTLNGGQYG